MEPKPSTTPSSFIDQQVLPGDVVMDLSKMVNQTIKLGGGLRQDADVDVPTECPKGPIGSTTIVSYDDWDGGAPELTGAGYIVDPARAPPAAPPDIPAQTYSADGLSTSVADQSHSSDFQADLMHAYYLQMREMRRAHRRLEVAFQEEQCHRATRQKYENERDKVLAQICSQMYPQFPFPPPPPLPPPPGPVVFLPSHDSDEEP